MPGSAVVEKDLVDCYESSIEGTSGREKESISRILVGEVRKASALERDAPIDWDDALTERGNRSRNPCIERDLNRDTPA